MTVKFLQSKTLYITGLILISCHSLTAQTIPEINPSEILTDPVYNSTKVYHKMLKFCRDTVMEIKQYDSMQRLVFWHSQSQPGRPVKTRTIFYKYNSAGKLSYQYFIESDHHKIWKYQYDSAARKTLVFEKNIWWFYLLPDQIELKKNLIKAIQTGEGNHPEITDSFVLSFDKLTGKMDSLRFHLHLEVVYDSMKREKQKVQYNPTGDTLFLIKYEYNLKGRINNILYKAGKQTYILHEFHYLPDTGHSAGKLYCIYQWNLERGDKNSPLSFGTTYYTYDNTGLIRVHEVYMGILLSDEQFKIKNSLIRTSDYYYLNKGTPVHIARRYYYGENGELIKYREKRKGAKKVIYQYKFIY